MCYRVGDESLKLKENGIIYLLLIAITLMPYGTLGQEFSSVILCAISLIVFIKNKNEIEMDKWYIGIIIGLIFTGLVSLIFTNNFTKTLSGLTVFVNAALMYIIFLQYKSHSMKILKFIVYILAISSMVFIIYQGGIYKIRIDGNIGYANTYGLVLLIGLYLSEVIEKNRFTWLMQVSLMLGIIYTQSRNTLIYLVIYLIIKVVYDFKKKEKFFSITNFFISIFIYFSIHMAGFGVFFILPLILLTIEYGYNKISSKAKNIITIILSGVGIPLLFLSDSNLSNRIGNISLTNGVFQERLIYFQDVIKALVKNPFGFGINSFEYSQYVHQSAFYDVKYVHNSILQVGYDMGLIGMAIFIMFGVWGGIILFKSTSKAKKYYIPLYVTIYLHSLLDFDFAYLVIWAIVVMIIAFAQEEINCTFKVKPNFVLISSLVLIFSLYLIVVNGFYSIGDKLNANRKLDEARKIYSINKAITFKDPDVYFRLAEIERKEGTNKDRDALNKSLLNLKEAERINPNDPRILGNIAFAYQSLDSDNAIEYYDKFLNKAKFHSKMYKVYYSFLSKKYDETKNGLYKDKMEELEKTYYSNLKILNPKAKYLKDQMSERFN